MKSRKENSKPDAINAQEIDRAVRLTKENAIIEATLKPLDTSHLTQLVVSLLRDQLQRQTSEQFEANHARAVKIRNDDPALFPNGPVTSELTLEVLWADRKNGLCSEQEKSIVFVDPEPSTGMRPKKGSFLQAGSSTSN